MKSPVIKYEYLSKRTKIALYSLGALALIALGFIAGIFVSVATPPKLGLIQNPITISPPRHIFQDYDIHEEPPVTASRWKYSSFEKEVKCLADNMYFEGRNQSTKGKIAVGLVTINRVKSKHFKNSICGVVWFQAKDRRSGKLTAHFSWTLDGKPDKINNKYVYQEIYNIAQAMLAEQTLDNFYDFTDGALYYHADYVKPYWKAHYELVAQIGDHIYYK